MTTIWLTRMPSPIGLLLLASSDRGAAGIDLDCDETRLRLDLLRQRQGVDLREGHAANRQLYQELVEYFDGKRARFTVRLDVRGTEFQRLVWAEMRRIPFGETRSYGEIASAVGRPKGARAVGMACNRNPLPIVIPCHRVVGADGSLVGFGGGLHMKERLLAIEHSPARVDG